MTAADAWRRPVRGGDRGLRRRLTGHSTAGLVAGPVPQAPRSAACTTAARAELVDVARRIYAQAVGGRNAAAARRRIERSHTLAVRRRRPATRRAIRAALRPLLKHQITRIDITARTAARSPATGRPPPTGRCAARCGSAPGRWAATSWPSVASATSSSDHPRADRRDRPLPGGRRGRAAAAVALPATTFPGRPRDDRRDAAHTCPPACAARRRPTRVRPRSGSSRGGCSPPSSAAPARSRAIRHAEKDPAFLAAVKAGDPAAVRAAIVGFFKDKHFHIVRGRVWNAARPGQRRRRAVRAQPGDRDDPRRRGASCSRSRTTPATSSSCIASPVPT